MRIFGICRMTSALKSCGRLAVIYTALSSGKRAPKHLSSFTYHSEPQRIALPSMASIRLIPALEDNYMYLLIDESTKECAAVDPVEPQKILAAVKEEGVTLTKVLTTHHHWDHAGGNEKLVQLTGPMNVYGGDDRIGALNNKVEHRDILTLGSMTIECLSTPCHTTGHICYYITGEKLDQPAVFTGDTLFVGACGKFFEGTPEQMYRALVEVLSKLPSNTRVFCGHEYTVGSLKYALHVEPENEKLKAKFDWAQDKRSKSQPTIPSTIGDEMAFNPFMRVGEPSVQKHAGLKDPVKVMGFLREEKNSFKPKM